MTPSGSGNGAGATGRHPGRALVIGGSMAGLLAARVLAGHFEQVTLVERDRLPTGPDHRKGVPQGRHAHGLLVRGKEILGVLFPGLLEELLADGSTAVDMGAELRWHHFGGWKVAYRSGLIALSQGRPFLEAHVRRRVLALPQVGVLEACDARGLRVTTDGRRVTGLAVRRSGSPADETLGADLVVDAGGRGSATPRWLEALGYGRPAETAIRIDVGYTSRIYRRMPADLGGTKALLVYPTPPAEKRMAAVLPLEEDRWMVTLGGWLGEHAPTDERGFVEFARGLPAPEVGRLLERAEPLTDPVVHRFPSNLRHHYERMVRWPEGLLVLGDALSSFNPIYGQGMTVSALEAVALDAALRRARADPGGLAGLPARFFPAAARIVDRVWGLTAGEDYRYPEVAGTRPPGTALINRYVARLHRTATRDPRVYGAFLGVMNLLTPPATLFRPGVVLRVLGRRAG